MAATNSNALFCLFQFQASSFFYLSASFTLLSTIFCRSCIACSDLTLGSWSPTHWVSMPITEGLFELHKSVSFFLTVIVIVTSDLSHSSLSSLLQVMLCSSSIPMMPDTVPFILFSTKGLTLKHLMPPSKN